MEILGPIISLLFLVVVARLLLKKVYPHAVLLAAGLLMLALAFFLKFEMPGLEDPTGFKGFDLFRYIKESFSKIDAGVGLMIMAIGGFVAYIDHIGASTRLVNAAMKPLSVLKKHPHITAVCVIPIGQILFICIPSAAGLSLLFNGICFSYSDWSGSQQAFCGFCNHSMHRFWNWTRICHHCQRNKYFWG